MAYKTTANEVNTIGTIKPIVGSSMALNSQKGGGCEKPNMGKGNHNPGDTKPPMSVTGTVPMPKA